MVEPFPELISVYFAEGEMGMLPYYIPVSKHLCTGARDSMFKNCVKRKDEDEWGLQTLELHVRVGLPTN